jgi:hypothetical protein
MLTHRDVVYLISVIIFAVIYRLVPAPRVKRFLRGDRTCPNCGRAVSSGLGQCPHCHFPQP